MAMPAPMTPADVSESITTDNGSNELSMSSWDDTNSNIMFFAPGSKKAKVLINGDNGMVTNFSKIKSQVWPVEHVFGHARHGRLLAAAAGLRRLHSLETSVSAPLTREASLRGKEEQALARG
ncbi:unnamed protein product [Triticum turgidum subsp. durum]|uniref:Uncharacterized protein n=1 Tax=Triticum turgidum subsp. durum TaxID=4567 RepID=A0A9R1APA1_TRITD|nr:unnamed protein product [Triticum turgidum subsp. durum]